MSTQVRNFTRNSVLIFLLCWIQNSSAAQLNTTFSLNSTIQLNTTSRSVRSLLGVASRAYEATFYNDRSTLRLPTDTSGSPIFALAGCIIISYGRYYWFGQSKIEGPTVTSAGVNGYSSEDLMTWRYEGMVLKGEDITRPYPGPYRIERPKVLYNDKTKKWIMFWHQDNAYWPFVQNEIGIAKADKITGPYIFQRAFRPGRSTSWDMTAFKMANGDAYLINSVDLKYMGVHKLQDDYLAVTETFCSTLSRGEAPAVFQTKDKLYMLASGLSGWDPNEAKQFSANEMCSEWQSLFPPAKDSKTTHNTQPGFVFPYKYPSGKTLFIYMGDRWNHKGPGGFGAASTIFLPLVPQDGGFALEYHDVWSIKDFEYAAVDGPE